MAKTAAGANLEDGWVAFVGAGPGDDGLMTMRGARLLGGASIVIAEAEVADRVRHLIAADAAVVEPADAESTARALTQAAKDGQFAVRLFPGDPLLSGGAAEVQACAQARVRYEIVPGVPAATGVPAYAGIALPINSGGELRVIHANEVSRVGYAAGTLVVLGAETAPADLGKMLIAAGWPDTTPFSITWEGSTTDQQTVVTTLGRIGPDLKAAVLAVCGPITPMTVTACGLPAMPTRLRTVDEEVNSTASNPPPLIASLMGAGGGAARTVRYAVTSSASQPRSVSLASSVSVAMSARGSRTRLIGSSTSS
jgi:siroheme synthase